MALPVDSVMLLPNELGDIHGNNQPLAEPETDADLS